MLGGGKFANGAMSGAFVHLFNAEGIFRKITKGLGKSLSKLWKRKGEIGSNIIQGFKGGFRGYRNVRDNAPWYARLMLKMGITGIEEGATGGLSGWSKISFDMFSGAYLDSFPTSRYSLSGFYLKAYTDDLRGVHYKNINLNPLDF